MPTPPWFGRARRLGLAVWVGSGGGMGSEGRCIGDRVGRDGATKRIDRRAGFRGRIGTGRRRGIGRRSANLRGGSGRKSERCAAAGPASGRGRCAPRCRSIKDGSAGRCAETSLNRRGYPHHSSLEFARQPARATNRARRAWQGSASRPSFRRRRKRCPGGRTSAPSRGIHHEHGALELRGRRILEDECAF